MRGRRIPVAAPDDAARLRGDNRRLDALRDELGLVLGDRRENMDCESISMSCEIKATLRARRSSFAITKTALNMRQSLSASLNCGRAAFVPLSTSVNSANNSPEADSRNLLTAACCASSPSPDRPCARVETR